MTGFLSGLRASIALWLITAGLAFGQQISIPGQVAEVGQLFPITFETPEADSPRNHTIQIVTGDGGRTMASFDIFGARTGVWNARAPMDPGEYRAVITQRDSTTPLQAFPFRVVFQPTPGALQVSRTQVESGGSVTVNVRVPDTRVYPNLWVGLFNLGRNIDPGGATIGDERLKYNAVNSEGSAGTVSLPRYPGFYELRLFDRQNGPYVLDRVRIEVTSPPQPGVISLNKDTFEVGERVRVTVSEDASLYFSPWVALFWPSDPQGTRPDTRRNWQWLNLEERVLDFVAPAEEGQYEIRLFDEGRTGINYHLDTVAFNVIASPQPDALKLEKTEFAIGEAINVSIQYDTARGQYSSWVGLFSKPAAATEGNAQQSVHRMAWNWIKNGEATALRAPLWPGEYEIRLYDRDGRRYILDRETITVTVPPTPDVLRLSSERLDLGEPFSVTAALPDGRAYPSPVVRIYYKVDGPSAGGAEYSSDVVQWNWIKSNEPVEFRGMNQPGTYVVRLYDRGDYGYVLDETEFVVEQRPLENALTTGKTAYRTGETISIRASVPDSRVFGSPIIELLQASGPYEGVAPVHRVREGYVWYQRGQADYSLQAPSTVGTFDVVFYDRQSYGYVLGRTQIQVYSDAADALRINKRSYAPGETIRVQTRIPPDRRLYSPQVRLMQSSFQLEGGVIGVEVPIQSRALNASEGETFDLQAPSAPGKYELRYYDRNNLFFILDIEEFEVTGGRSSDARRQYVRLSPMPGESQFTPAALPRSSTTSPDPDAPGADTTDDTAEPSTAEDTTDPSNTGGDTPGTDTADTTGDTPGETPADAPTSSTPRLFVEALTPAGMQPVTQISPGDSFRVRVTYADPPQDQPPSVSVSAAGAAALDLPLRRDEAPGSFVTDIARVPVLSGE